MGPKSRRIVDHPVRQGHLAVGVALAWVQLVAVAGLAEQTCEYRLVHSLSLARLDQQAEPTSLQRGRIPLPDYSVGLGCLHAVCVRLMCCNRALSGRRVGRICRARHLDGCVLIRQDRESRRWTPRSLMYPN